MEGLKELALSLLYLDIQETKLSPIVVSHPYTNTGTVGQLINGEVRMLNLLENEGDLNTWHRGMEEIIQKAKKPYDLYFLLNKPYALAFVKFAMPYLSKEDFSMLLSDAWIRTEIPSNDANFKTDDFVRLFSAADKSVLMDPSEYEHYLGLPNELTIYRGVKSNRLDKIAKPSWTLDYDKAEWFAKRFDENGIVYAATISKGHVLALFERRSESEVVVDPKYLNNITQAEAPVEDYEMSL